MADKDSCSGCFWMGKETYKVPMKMHKDNRHRLLSKFVGKETSPNTVILLQGGTSEFRNDSDHEPLFRQESYFQYLFGVKEPDCYGALDIDSKKAYLFVPKLPPIYAVWMGKIKTCDEFKEIYQVDEVRYTDEIPKVLKDELNCKMIYTLEGGINTDSDKKHKGATFPGIDTFRVDKTTLFPELRECRVIKSKDEIELLRYVNKISSGAHEHVMKVVTPGIMEYEMEAAFYWYAYTKGGCRNVSYSCICCSGLNGAILHYGHAGAPNSRALKDGEMILNDMGGEYHCYTSDVTRSYPVNGKFTEEQKIIYEVVLAAQTAVIERMKPGVEWLKMHKLANKVIIIELKKHGFLKGDVREMKSVHIGALFMPHGLGHFMGLDTHDVGGYPEGVQRPTAPGEKKLRTIRKLEENMVITVEPGIYFIEALLEPALKDPAYSKYLVAERIQQFMNFGGVRIEDDVVVTKDGCENLTTAAKTIQQIEKIMAEGKNK